MSRRFGTIHGSIKYINYGSLIGADELGNETGNFNASDIAISIGYSINIPKTSFFIGSNIRLINSNISNLNRGEFWILSQTDKVYALSGKTPVDMYQNYYCKDEDFPQGW